MLCTRLSRLFSVALCIFLLQELGAGQLLERGAVVEGHGLDDLILLEWQPDSVVYLSSHRGVSCWQGAVCDAKV